MMDDKLDEKNAPSKSEGNGKDEQAPVPIQVLTQRIPIPSPEAGESIRAALDAHEADACVRDKPSGLWVYVRQRALLNLEAMQKETEETKDEPSGIVGPDGSTPLGA